VRLRLRRRLRQRFGLRALAQGLRRLPERLLEPVLLDWAAGTSPVNMSRSSFVTFPGPHCEDRGLEQELAVSA